MSGPDNRFTHIPPRLSGLVELAYNLWWSWHPEARVLFKQLNQVAWKTSVHNPVRMLRDAPVEFFDTAEKNAEYLRRYEIVMNRFRRYMNARTGWFREQYPEGRTLTIAYFSAEYGLHHSLPMYAGGLGFLAGDFLKECSDLGVPLVAVGFMYSEGYLHQHIRADGWQEGIRETLDRDAAPVKRVLNESGEQLVIRVPYIEPPISVAVWKVDVGRVPLYLLDTDIPLNDPASRRISSNLYTSDREERLKQEIVLGIGGRKVLHSLGILYSAVHLNEGHPAFALLERIRERVERGIPFGEALCQVQVTSVFTTHTPVAAGHDVFPEELMDRYFSTYYPALGIDRETFFRLGAHPDFPGEGFNMTVLAMRLSACHNAVSRRHGELARQMWRNLWKDLPYDRIPIDAITNGVHLPSWMNPRIEDLIDTYVYPVTPNWQQEHDDETIWDLIDEIPDEKLWDLHFDLKIKLINRIRERKRIQWAKGQEDPRTLVTGGLLLNPSTLTIGFARRFATYKRAGLIFSDMDRLRRLVTDRWRPVQIVFAGKAHPSDDDGKRVLQQIYQIAQLPVFEGRIAFVEDYSEQSAQYLVHGVDVWLNNPLPPMEASGTSGMKAALNGVINLSILDGWWLEGYNGRNGWAFGSDSAVDNRDEEDARAIYNLLENEVVPLYYSSALDGIPHGWVSMMKESIKSNAPRFSARRMVKEYVSRYYPEMMSGADVAYSCVLKR
ncbi:MAG: alpha-glucan family phosphorylase [Methanoregula sp.]|uniref:alpha-glucan family phosphorylase n=1 Tax=Methanoregula sp. TaxID=2052170 RepID=UPI003D11E485